MSLEKTMNAISHYAQKAAKAILTPVNTTIALVTLGTALSFNPIQAQTNGFKNTNMEITENGYGQLAIDNEDLNPVEGATVTWTPVSIPGDSIPNPYVYTTGATGVAPYDVLVFHDITEGISKNYAKDLVRVRPNPSTDFTFNFLSKNHTNNPLQIFDIQGRLVGNYKLSEFDNDIAVYHVNLSDKANGVYFARSIIDGKVQSAKIVKVDGCVVGDLGSSLNTSFDSFKQTLATDTAIYDILIQAEGYYDLSDTRKVVEGDNGWGFYTLISDAPAPIDNQDLSGIITDLNDDYNPIEGALVEVEILSSGVILYDTTDSDGSFMIDSVPLGEDILFRAGGISGKYSIVDFPFTTISEVVNPADSVWPYFDVVLPDELSSSTTLDHAIDQNDHGTNQDTIKFYLGNSFYESEKTQLRTYFSNLQADENNSYLFEESFTQLNNEGINIEYGVYGTQTNATEILTPLGNKLYPVISANSTMGAASYIRFVHEIKRALGYDEVAWAGVESVMETPVQDYTLEDKDIARELSRMYWNATYLDEKTYIPLQYLAEDMSSKSSNKAVKNVKARIDELNKNTEQKIVDENAPNYFNSSSSYGDVKFNYNAK